MSSGLSYAPPLYYFKNITYDPEFFTSANNGLTQSYADATYLKRTGVALSTATITSFTGPVQCNGGLFISGGLSITGGLTLDTLTMSGLATFNGPSTFNVPPTMSGGNISSNTIPALSIVNSSLTQAQVSTGLQFMNLGVQNFSGSKTFAGSATNQTVINITNTVSPLFYSGSIAFITACTTNYLNLTTSNFDSMMYIGQPIANGVNQPYGFTMCDYNSLGTGIRISGTGAARNCNINLNGTVVVDQLLTCNNGLYVNLGNISTPNNAILGNIYSDIINNYDQITGTDIILNPNNFVQCLVNAGNNSVLPTAPIGFGGLKIGWNCSNLTGETDFLNLANYTNAGGYNFYTMNASTTPSLIGSLTPTALTIPGSLTNNKIVNSSSTLPYHIQNTGMSLPATTTGDPRSGFLIGWNGLSGSNGETDFTNLNQGGNQGGFLFGNIPTGGSYQKLVQISPLNATGLRIYPQCGQIQVDDQLAGAYSLNLLQGGSTSAISSKGINTTLFIQCGNGVGTGVNVFQVATNNITPLVNFSPASTTTFNASHPTTSLGNNISTNTTQYSTVGYVNSVSGTALLTSNNQWTGTNDFKNSTNGITTTATATTTSQYFGSGRGNATNIVVGSTTSLFPITGTGGFNVAISPGNSSLNNNTGSSSIAIGGGCGNSQTTGFNNIYLGLASGAFITTGSNNICTGSNSGNGIVSGSSNIAIGNNAWSTGTSSFSNCTVIGASAPAPLSSNSIILGSTAETVYVQGASQLTNTLLIGTTVASNNLQVNGNIIQPVGTLYTATGTTTFTSIPPIILFTPIAGMAFVLPTPVAGNAGQQLIIRRIATGSNTAVAFSATGGGAVFVPLNSGTGATSLSVLATWQLTFLCANNLYYQIG